MPHVTFYLTVGGDGKAVMTGLEPVVRRIMGTERLGVYCRPGDWLLVRNLCREWVERTLGRLPPVGKPVKLKATMEILEELNPADGDREVAWQTLSPTLRRPSPCVVRCCKADPHRHS